MLRVLASALSLCLFGVAVRADAQSPLLHEFIPPDPAEDVEFAATLLDGDLPAAMQTPSGITTAPDPRRPPDSSHLYDAADPEDAPDATYSPDRDTRRPDVEAYEDPFSPSTVPFKRLRAYDAVSVDYTLKVRDKSLDTIAVGGTIRADEDPFYGDMSVQLVPNQPVRLPSVGPSFRVLRATVNPNTPFELQRDRADNFYIRATERKTVRLVLQLAAPRASFGSEFGDVSWSTLSAFVQPQPTAHQEPFRRVAEAIGISRSMTPKEVVTKLVAYFRSFVPSEDPPRGNDDIYLDLALSKKGVCRHRAFAFLVTGLNIGIPTRMVVNEAHAWVEVFDGRIWHRVDLGGAAEDLEQTVDASRPPHQPPPDPYGWPEQRDSAMDLAQRERAQALETASPPNGRSDQASPSPTGSASELSAPSDPNAASHIPVPDAPEVDVKIHRVDKDVRRGLPLRLVGEARREGQPCRQARIVVSLQPAGGGAPTAVGSLSTDDRGAYDGWVVVPHSFALGDYDLRADVAPGTDCGGS